MKKRQKVEYMTPTGPKTKQMMTHDEIAYALGQKPKFDKVCQIVADRAVELFPDEFGIEVNQTLEYIDFCLEDGDTIPHVLDIPKNVMEVLVGVFKPGLERFLQESSDKRVEQGEAELLAYWDAEYRLSMGLR